MSLEGKLAKIESKRRAFARRAKKFESRDIQFPIYDI